MAKKKVSKKKVAKKTTKKKQHSAFFKTGEDISNDAFLADLLAPAKAPKTATGPDITWADTLVPAMEKVEAKTWATTLVESFEKGEPVPELPSGPVITENVPSIPGRDMEATFDGIITVRDVLQQEVAAAQFRDPTPIVPRVPELPPYNFEDDVKTTISRIGARLEEMEIKASRQDFQLKYLQTKLVILEKPGFVASVINFVKSLFN